MYSQPNTLYNLYSPPPSRLASALDDAWGWLPRNSSPWPDYHLLRGRLSGCPGAG
jgi:hypothetical protein